jgi:uncharacterized DUF497 family protein
VIVTWDNAKGLANLDKHGLDFADLELEFFVKSVAAPVRDRRFKAIGSMRHGRVIVVIFAPLGTESVSVISMRPANRKERSLFHGRSN